MMRILLLTTLVSVPLLHAADPPNKRGGGLFGFGSQKTEQISDGLFPRRDDVSPIAPATTAPSGSDRGGIFRSGQPNSVDAVSYVIQNGRKIERPIETAKPTTPPEEIVSTPVAAAMAPSAESGVELASNDDRKRGGLFAFGRRGDSSKENEVVTPVPAPDAFAPPRATPAPSPLVSDTPAPAPSPNAEKEDTPNFVGEQKEKNERFGWIPFLSRRKADAAPEVAAPVIAAAQPVPTAVPVAGPATARAAVPKPAPDTTKTAASTTFEVPRNDAKKEEKASPPSGGILSPIANIRVPRKELDLSSAETIIQNGEIVAGSETNFETITESESPGQRQAPQIVNGVKTYVSWDDVTARSSSAADKIIGSMR